MDGKRIIELHRFVSIFSIRQSSFVLVLSSSFSKGWLFETRMFRSFPTFDRKSCRKLLVRSTFATRSQEYTYPTNKEGRKIVKLILIPY